jgi:pyridoxal phosphate enzyme (YggS family)
MIGHLQRNKVKYIAEFVHLIHGVDSLKTLQEINKQAIKYNRTIDCLLQVKIAHETTKFGLHAEEVIEILKSTQLTELNHINITGLMGMASFTDDNALIRQEFMSLNQLFQSLKPFTRKNVKMEILSMGMSGDFAIAIEEGSTMIRIGSAIFGQRN